MWHQKESKVDPWKGIQFHSLNMLENKQIGGFKFLQTWGRFDIHVYVTVSDRRAHLQEKKE